MRKWLIIVVFISVSSLLAAQAAYKPVKDTTALKTKIDNMSKQTTAIESDFVQVKNLSMLSEKITSKGHFWFLLEQAGIQKNNYLRWEYSTPYPYIIAINKDKVMIKDETKIKKYDMNSNKVFKEINDIMISCVNGTVLNSNKFKITYFENGTGYKLELQPTAKNMKESLKKINMYFDKNVSSVQKLEMQEPTDDLTTIDFINKKINEPIAREKFILTK